MQNTRISQNFNAKQALPPIMEELISNTVLSSTGRDSEPITYKSVSKEAKVGAEKSKRVGILQENISRSSLLYKNFAFRNADSLQRALDEEERKLLELYLARRKKQKEEYCASEGEMGLTPSMLSTTESKLTDMKTQTETTEGSVKSLEQSRLKYLMGLPLGGEEEALHEKESIVEEVFVDQLDAGESEAMKQARRYLRAHKIFEFFQFIIAHLLSALPDDPIEFILDLFDKCIIFRAGMGPPPVLYEKKHIGNILGTIIDTIVSKDNTWQINLAGGEEIGQALFNLMDRMRTGYIEKEQYYTGMKTLGICSYNVNPPTSAEGLVHKDYFVEEAYENLVSLLNDLIRRRWIFASTPPHQMKTPPPTPQLTVSSSGASEAFGYKH